VTARVRSYLPALAWAALIVLLSSRPTLPVPLEAGSDKIAHFGAYAVLGLLTARAFSATGYSAVAAILAVILFGATDELHQSFVPGRSADLADWIADSLGAVAGVSLYHWIMLRGGRTPRAAEVRTDSALP
jgi:VanZ family protein